MWILFGGTSDYKEKLKTFLVDNIEGYTLLEGTSSWKNTSLEAQVILFWSKEDALKVKKFLHTSCMQKEVPIYKLSGEFENGCSRF